MMNGKQHKSLFAILLVLLLLFIVVVAVGLTAGEYNLSWWSIDSGSASLSTAGGYGLSGTIGQPDASSVFKSASGTYGLVGGFLGVALSNASSETLPILLVTQPGYAAIELTWTATNDPAVNAYRISRAISGTLHFTPVITVANTTYYDTDAALVYGERYCYQVEALSINHHIVRASNVACARLGQLNLWIPEVWTQPSTTATIPINIENAHGLPLAVADIWLEYDEAILRPLGVVGTSLTHNYIWNYTVITGTVPHRVQVTTQGGATPPVLYGEGGLFWLSVEVLGQTGDSSALNLREYINGVGGSAIYAPTDLTQTIPLVLQDGVLYVEDSGPYRLGDLNGNGLVEAIDAYIALQIGAGQVVATLEQVNAGDINGDSLVNSADATMILYYAGHGRWPMLANVIGASHHQISFPIGLILGQEQGQAGKTIVVKMTVENITDWAGGDFIIAYDQNFIADVSAVMLGELTQPFNLEYQASGNGLLYISIADDASISGSGQILSISLKLADNVTPGSVSPLTFSAIKLYDNFGRNLATSDLQYEFLIQHGSVTVTEDVRHKVYLPLVIR